MQIRHKFQIDNILALKMLAIGVLLPVSVAGAVLQNDKAMEAHDVPSALAILEVQNPAQGKRILLDVPDIVGEGETFPVKVTSKMPNTEWVAILVEKSKNPFIGQFDVNAPSTQGVEAKIKLSQTSKVIAVVRADGKYYRVDKEVKVAAEKCK